jgi:hypothetical protein
MISALLWSGLSEREKVGFLLVELLALGMGRSQLKKMSSLSMFSLFVLLGYWRDSLMWFFLTKFKKA